MISPRSISRRGFLERSASLAGAALVAPVLVPGRTTAADADATAKQKEAVEAQRGMQALPGDEPGAIAGEAKLTKADIRELSKKLGLSTWDKPSFACLSSRFPYGNKITREKLTAVGEAEIFLKGLGIRQLRVRHHGDTARIEVAEDNMTILFQKKEQIVDKLKELGYTYVTMDLQGYRTGSMNEVLTEK